jgi:hypothetical protein
MLRKQNKFGVRLSLELIFRIKSGVRAGEFLAARIRRKELKIQRHSAQRAHKSCVSPKATETKLKVQQLS